MAPLAEAMIRKMSLLPGIVIRSPRVAELRRGSALAVVGCAMVESFELDTGILDTRCAVRMTLILKGLQLTTD